MNRVEAGYKLANEINGVIHKIPWDRKQVIRVAKLCDKILNGSLVTQRVTAFIISGEASIQEAAAAVRSIYQDPYIASERAAFPSLGLRILIEKKPDEFNRLKETDKALYDSLFIFKSTFDSSFSKERLQWLLQDKEFPGQFMQKELEEPMDIQKLLEEYQREFTQPSTPTKPSQISPRPMPTTPQSMPKEMSINNP